ncbi:MAG TPA: phosphoribosylanthranilate isomerase [Chloroflexota bacterium]
MTRVKICGLRRVEHAGAAIEAGADMLGFIFYPAVPRYVEPSAVRDLLEALPRGSFETVGVFVNEAPARIDEIAELVGLDLVQLAGDEPSELNGRLSRPVARTVHVDAATTAEQIAARAAGARLIHLDTRKPGRYGGTGASFDWRVAREAGALGPVLLAGGLSPENVADAIAAARPWGVDVSSGVEREGVKDPDRIRAFLAAARSVDR